MWCVYTYKIEYYSAVKKELLPFVTTWMNLEGILLSEISQTGRMGSKIKIIHRKKSRMVIARGWRDEENRKKLVNRYKLSIKT